MLDSYIRKGGNVSMPRNMARKAVFSFVLEEYNCMCLLSKLNLVSRLFLY